MTMMPESSKINIDDYGSSRLLNDIEEISKALYLHDAPPKTSLPPKYVKDDLLLNDQKSSIWKWKPLKALTHMGNHKLNSTFFLHIHSIEGLPLNLNDLNLRVYWKRKNEVLKSHSIRVKEGVAEFEETLIHRCLVYVSKSGVHNDVAKYAPKLSLLYASIVGAPNLDIGKHWIDLTRLLPLTLIDLEEEKIRYGKWVTSFKLTGKAKGAKINVSFGFSLSGDNFIRRRAHVSSLPFEGPSISQLYDLLDDNVKTSYSKELNATSDEVYDGDFTVIDRGVEFSEPAESFCIETIDVAELFDDEVCGDFEADTVFDDISFKENDNICIEESNKELELFLHNLSISESRELDFSFHENQFLELEGGKIVKSRSLDDLTNIVADDFMNLVGSDSEPESPRELLLRQFEKEALASGNFFSDLDDVEDQEDCCNIFDSSLLFQEAEAEHNNNAGPSLISRRKAKMLENLETETLMENWGLNERAFQNSPRTESGAFGSPVYLSPERLHKLPPLGDGLGSFLKIQNGGFLRSMNPFLFRKAKNGEKLVLQVSNSVVLPLAMGSNGIDILLKWATVGPENMLFHVTRIMPMEVITGNSLQQAAWKAESEMEVLEREDALLDELKARGTTTSIPCEIDLKYVSVGNIIPSAIEKIQYLLIDGLRIQSGISNENPPSTINSTTCTSNNDIEELINTSISLEDWIKLESDRFDPNCSNFGKSMLALQMVLRDPLRDYEPVGIPMLALIEVERSTSVDPMFRVNEVHVTGFKADFQKKQLSGSRWLHSSGMTGKTKRHSLTKSTELIRSSIRSINKVKHEEILWSVSSYVHGEEAKFKELSGLSLYLRNPDIVFK